MTYRDNGTLDYRKIDVYEEYRQIPVDEIDRLAKEEIFTDERLTEM